MIPEVCPDCGSKELEWNTEGLICKKCGLIIVEGVYSGQRMLV